MELVRYDRRRFRAMRALLRQVQGHVGHRDDDDERRCGYNGDRSLLLAAPGVARAAHRTLWHIMACVRGSLVSHAMHGCRIGAAHSFLAALLVCNMPLAILPEALFGFDRGLYMKQWV